MAPPATTNESCESCGGNKRGVGAVVITLGGFNLIGLIICSLFATDVPLYAGFGWLNVILSLVVLIVASLYSCQCCSEEACPSRAVGGFMVAYCVLAFISFIVCASGADGAIRHNCEDTVACASATPWYGDADCGQKTSRFQICSQPEASDRRRLQSDCRTDYCTSNKPGCCAPDNEAATCSNGYVAVYSGAGCFGYDNGDYTCCAPATDESATDASAGDTLYYSKWGDDCQENGGHDDECRAFATEEDCWNYCNPHSDNDNDQCDAHGHDPENCSNGSSITGHVRALALWSSLLILLLLIPAVVWTVCLFRPDPPKAEEPPTVGGVQLATVQVRQAAPTVVYAQQPAPVVLAPAQPQVIYAPQPPPVSGQVIYEQERR